jgi:hypothetical protein
MVRMESGSNETVEQAQRDIAAVAGAQNAASGETPAAPNQRQGWGLEYDRMERREEVETTSFQAEGLIRTQDGHEVAFQVRLNMSRSFVEENRLSIRAGDAALKDPLVLNFDGRAAELGSQTFRFDIDADGTADQISTLSSGSAFLALDRNGDGTVTDGSELFGPQTGDGFAELAALDQDGNRWIDANDPIFNKLRVWSVDPTGRSTLAALGEVGVGAIYLGSADTPFQLKSPDNELLGQVRATGVFIREDGTVGTVQQIDLKA